MITKELIQKLIIPDEVIKNQIEQLLLQAFIGIQNLRKMSLDKNLSLEYIESIEQLFFQNQFNVDECNLPKYLKKYAECLSKFWESYTYYESTHRSKGRFNLFTSLKENDLKMLVHHSEIDCAKILRGLEDFWIASNQIYTKHKISIIKNEYLR